MSSKVSPSAARTSAETIWRSWSNGMSPSRWYAAGPSGRLASTPASGADHSAASSALPPTGPSAVMAASLASRPNSSGAVAGRPAGSNAWSKVMAPSVRVPVLSVKSTSMLPRSSMVTSRLTSTFRRASSREPVDRLTLTMAGSS